jgi:uncharacterized protein
MIARNSESLLLRAAHEAPVIAVVGPRQSGKSTLCRNLFRERPLVSLEDPDTRAFATEDPRGFLAQYTKGAVFDEVQRVPELPSYLQGLVDADPSPGRFVLTGSENLTLSAHLSQSLAGRVRTITVLPCFYEEVQRFEEHPKSLTETLWAGGYPRIHDQSLHPPTWLHDYIRTYVERDVRQIVNVADLRQFQSFLGTSATRTSQLQNASSLGADVGLTHTSVLRWLSILETCYLTYTLKPYFRNLGKRLSKAPKFHFWDSGVVCALLGIRSPDELLRHPLRGAVFESWVTSEVRKHFLAYGVEHGALYYRDQKGHEVDLLIELGTRVLAMECKSGATLASDAFEELEYFANAVQADPLVQSLDKAVVYGGEESQARSLGSVVPWSRLGDWLARYGR